MKDQIIRILFANIGIVLLLFAIIFYGSAYITSSREVELDLSTTLELRIPYIELAYIFYYGAFFQPVLLFYFLQTKHDIQLLSRRMTLSILIGGACFLVLPTRNRFQDLEISRSSWIGEFAASFTGTYNMMPSLHVTLSTLMCTACLSHATKLWRIILVVWLGILIVSTVVTHQHHIIDVFTGLLLALFSYFIYQPKSRREQ